MQGLAPPRVRLPITPTVLSKLLQVWSVQARYDNAIYRAQLLWAAACVAFFGFLRSGELTPSSADAPPSLTVGFPT